MENDNQSNIPRAVKFPPIDPALVAALDKLYPERSADLNWTDREVWFKSGQRDVVRALRAELARQQENILKAT